MTRTRVLRPRRTRFPSDGRLQRARRPRYRGTNTPGGPHRGAIARTPYLRRDALLSRGELAFFKALRHALDNRFGISIKTRLADVIQCPEDLWQTPHGRRISQKHLDFVLYDENSSIVAAIELDDRSHDRPERRARDRFIEDVLADCGVVLLRVRAAARYDISALRLQILSVCTRTATQLNGTEK